MPLWQKETDLYVFGYRGIFFPEYFQPAIVKSTVVKAQAWEAAVHTQDRKSLLFLKLLCVPQDFPAKQHSMLQLCKGALLLVLQMKKSPIWDGTQWVKYL